MMGRKELLDKAEDIADQVFFIINMYVRIIKCIIDRYSIIPTYGLQR